MEEEYLGKKKHKCKSCQVSNILQRQINCDHTLRSINYLHATFTYLELKLFVVSMKHL